MVVQEKGGGMVSGRAITWAEPPKPIKFKRGEEEGVRWTFLFKTSYSAYSSPAYDTESQAQSAYKEVINEMNKNLSE